jgi:hypothetical protein
VHDLYDEWLSELKRNKEWPNERDKELPKSELSTIRKYVEALGGKIEIVANFGDERLVLG